MKISELKGKHDHALTSWLKVIIFSLLMIAPLFASISQWVYVSFNKNAKDSYSNQYVEKLTNVNSSNLLVENNQYIVNYNSNNSATATVNFTINDTNLYDYIDTNNKIISKIYFINQSGSRINLEFTDSTTLRVDNWENYTKSFTFILSSTSYNPVNTSLPYANLYLITYNTQKLDNAFYYGVEKMTESDLFNWTQNTTLYSGIKTMTDNLEIQTPAIAILLTYWFILTIIYVIIDIVLKGFTTLTHLIMGAK